MTNWRECIGKRVLIAEASCIKNSTVEVIVIDVINTSSGEEFVILDYSPQRGTCGRVLRESKGLELVKILGEAPKFEE